MSKIIHFELPADDLARAATFYQNVLGWETTPYGDFPYWLVTAGAEAEPGADGALSGRDPVHQGPVVVAGVDDVDAALDRAVTHGGTVVQPKVAVPGMGWSAYFVDTEGNVVGIFQPDESAGLDG